MAGGSVGFGSVGFGALVGVGVSVGSGVGVSVGTGDGVGVSVGIGVEVYVGTGEGVGVSVGTSVGVFVGSVATVVFSEEDDGVEVSSEDFFELQLQETLDIARERDKTTTKRNLRRILFTLLSALLSITYLKYNSFASVRSTKETSLSSFLADDSYSYRFGVSIPQD